MDAGYSPVRQARAQHRHELHTLTYVTLDQANGGVVRNLTHEGIGVQAVAAVRPRQQVRVRFELRYPRLRVETRGEVMWSTFSGQCGIRFLDLPPRMIRQINEWIFGNLLEGISLHAEQAGSMFAAQDQAARASAEEDGLLVSATPAKVIPLPARHERAEPESHGSYEHEGAEPTGQLDWLSQPLSERGVAATVNTLVVFAAVLLFALVFLAINHEAPRWPLAMTVGAALCVAAMYWGFSHLFGGSTVGARLARLAGYGEDGDEDADAARFR
jgi:hypothetical protein